MKTDHAGGGTLADRLQSGPLNRDELEQLAQDLLGMLASLHANGTPHRDLSPASVRLDSAGRLHSSKIGTQRGSAPGGPADVAADLYACGALLADAAGPDASAPVMVVIGMLTADADLRPASATEALSLLGAPTAHLPAPSAPPAFENPIPSAPAPLPAPAPPPAPPPAPVAAPQDVPTEALAFPPVAFPPVVDGRPVADTPLVQPLAQPFAQSLGEPFAQPLAELGGEPFAAYPAPYPRLRRRPSRRVVLAGLGGLVGVLAVLGGVLLLGGGDDPAPAEVPPPASTSLQQQLDDLDGVIDTLGASTS